MDKSLFFNVFGAGIYSRAAGFYPCTVQIYRKTTNCDGLHVLCLPQKTSFITLVLCPVVLISQTACGGGDGIKRTKAIKAAIAAVRIRQAGICQD